MQLAEEIGDPPGTLVLLSNSGRCGSTLLTQLFEGMPNTLAISEPEVLMPFAHDALFDDVPRERRLVLIRSCIRLLCKSARIDKNGVPPTVLIKPKAHGIAIAKELSELYPEMKHLYMYRHPGYNFFKELILQNNLDCRLVATLKANFKNLSLWTFNKQ